LLISKRFLWFLVVAPLGLAAGAQAQEEAVPDDLPVVEVELSQVGTLMGVITHPQVEPKTAERAFRDLVELGPLATDELVAIYQDDEETDHRSWVAARALAKIGGAAATGALLEGIHTGRFIERIGAASALGIIKGDDARLALEEALFDPGMEVRATAADSLAEIGHQGSSVALARALGHPENFHRGRSLPVRGHIVVALGRTGGETAIEALVAVLEEDDESLRAMAVKALEESTGANPVGSPGNGSTCSQAEVNAWQAWWLTHSSARVQAVEGDGA